MIDAAQGASRSRLSEVNVRRQGKALDDLASKTGSLGPVGLLKPGLI
jgi:hypothetical protein